MRLQYDSVLDVCGADVTKRVRAISDDEKFYCDITKDEFGYCGGIIEACNAESFNDTVSFRTFRDELYAYLDEVLNAGLPVLVVHIGLNTCGESRRFLMSEPEEIRSFVERLSQESAAFEKTTACGETKNAVICGELTRFPVESVIADMFAKTHHYVRTYFYTLEDGFKRTAVPLCVQLSRYRESMSDVSECVRELLGISIDINGVKNNVYKNEPKI